MKRGVRDPGRRVERGEVVASRRAVDRREVPARIQRVPDTASARTSALTSGSKLGSSVPSGRIAASRLRIVAAPANWKPPPAYTRVPATAIALTTPSTFGSKPASDPSPALNAAMRLRGADPATVVKLPPT